MQPKKIGINKKFTGRETELNRLFKIQKTTESAIVILYGRRRVGKTELLEQAFRNRNVLKIEGIEEKTEAEEMRIVLEQMAVYTEEPLLNKIKPTSWREVFQIIARYVKEGTWTLYFEEVQWLANYKSDFVAEFKYVWDNEFRYNPRLITIFCGSSPSFIIGKIIKSKALYNRSQHVFPLTEFNLIETKKFLKDKSNHEVLDTYLTVGGIPEYLKLLTSDSSIFLSLCTNSFTRGGSLTHEYEKIFISQFARNKNYQKIIEFLSKRSFATRTEILDHIKTETGGTLTNLLLDLETCAFIECYHPVDRGAESLLKRFCMKDPYLHFYFKFIKPISANIEKGMYEKDPTIALKIDTYRKWLGFSFERMCRYHHMVIAKILGFHAVAYKSGAYFNRKEIGCQIDLCFDREDRVYTLCEIKYQDSKIGTSVISEFEKKLQSFSTPDKYTIQKVLISVNGADKALLNRAYFDQIITLADLFRQKNW